MITQSTTKLEGNPMTGFFDRCTDQGARTIQPKLRPVRPGEKWSASKGGPVFSKLLRLERTDRLSFRPKFPEILVGWIALKVFSRFLAMSEVVLVHTWWR